MHLMVASAALFTASSHFRHIWTNVVLEKMFTRFQDLVDFEALKVMKLVTACLHACDVTV